MGTAKFSNDKLLQELGTAMSCNSDLQQELKDAKSHNATLQKGLDAIMSRNVSIAMQQCTSAKFLASLHQEHRCNDTHGAFPKRIRKHGARCIKSWCAAKQGPCEIK